VAKEGQRRLKHLAYSIVSMVVRPRVKTIGYLPESTVRTCIPAYLRTCARRGERKLIDVVEALREQGIQQRNIKPTKANDPSTSLGHARAST